MVSAYILSSTTVFNIDNTNKKKFLEYANHHIRMIFHGSHDTKDWSNEDENNIVILFHNINVFTVYIKNAALEGIETSLKTIQICIVLNICTVRLKKTANNYKLHNVYYKKIIIII